MSDELALKFMEDLGVAMYEQAAAWHNAGKDDQAQFWHELAQNLTPLAHQFKWFSKDLQWYN